MSYSQRDEEPFILATLGETGRFLDIGAYDGKTFSNTLALVERGWSGVCVEPSPSAFVGLLKQHRDTGRIVLVNAAVGPQTGLLRFWDSNGDAVSTSVECHRKLWEAKGAQQFREIHVMQITPADLLAAFPGPYDFVNIDTEGTSVDVLKAMPMDDRPVLVCVEHDRRFAELQQFMQDRGYREGHQTGENSLMVRG